MWKYVVLFLRSQMNFSSLGAGVAEAAERRRFFLPV